MWRASDAQNDFIDSAAKAQELPRSKAAETVPTPQEVFFEAGAVLAVMLGLALVANLFLMSAGIPS